MCIRVKSCCCCSSTETGTKVIAILGLIFSGLSLLVHLALLNWQSVFGSLIEILLSGMLYYGTVKRKTAYIMAWMVLCMIGLIFLYALAAAALIIAVTMDEDTMQQFLEKFGTSVDPRSIQIAVFLCFVVLAIVAAIQTYLWMVVYSFHKEIQEENTPGLRYAEAGGHIDMMYKGKA